MDRFPENPVYGRMFSAHDIVGAWVMSSTSTTHSPVASVS